MDKIKLITVIGTRPEVIRLSRIIPMLDKHFLHYLVHTGQNFDHELNQIFFDELKIRNPDFYLDSNRNSISAANTIGNLITSIDLILEKISPDALLVLGDTNSCLSVISAKRRKIPIFHIEAGNRCFDLRVPEEINRRIVDHTADINMTYSNIAKEYLLREGLPPAQVITIGSPMFEVLRYYEPFINKSDILQRLNLRQYMYFLVSLHREENVESDKNFTKFVQLLHRLSNVYTLPIIVSAHPRTQKRIDVLSSKFPENVKLMKPLGFFDYIKLQQEAKVVLSDSGTISEESSILNFPALNLRETHERQEAMEEGSVMMVGLNYDRIVASIEILSMQLRGQFRTLRLVQDYSVPNVSDKVVRIIQSYVDYVNRFTWHKY